MKRFIQILLTVMLTFGASNALLAAPSLKICNDSDVYTRLECRQVAIADQLGYTADEVFAEDTPLHGRMKPARLKSIKNSANKADRAALKNDKKMFKKIARAESRGNKGQDLGHLMPNIPADDDGNPKGIANDDICDYEQGDSNANCAAIEYVEADDGSPVPCNPNKKNKGKGKGKGGGNDKFDGLECDRWLEEDDEDDMKDGAMQLEDTYIETEENLQDMNFQLDLVNEVLAEPAAVFGENGENGCDIPETNTDLNNSVIALRVIHAGLAGGAGISSAWAGQTIVTLGFGGNLKTFQMPFEVAAMLANFAYIAVDEAAKLEAGSMQAAIMKCSADTADAVAALLEEVADLKALMQQEHEAIVDNDDENTTEIINVLNTPHGLRDKFPKP